MDDFFSGGTGTVSLLKHIKQNFIINDLSSGYYFVSFTMEELNAFFAHRFDDLDNIPSDFKTKLSPLGPDANDFFLKSNYYIIVDSIDKDDLFWGHIIREKIFLHNGKNLDVIFSMLAYNFCFPLPRLVKSGGVSITKNFKMKICRFKDSDKKIHYITPYVKYKTLDENELFYTTALLHFKKNPYDIDFEKDKFWILFFLEFQSYIYTMILYIVKKYDIKLEDVIIVPIPPSRVIDDYRKSSMHVIGKTISEQLNLVDGTNVLKRIKNVLPKKKQTRDQRWSNDNFDSIEFDSSLINNRVIILIDDIITTGSSFYQFSEELMNLGAKEVYNMSIAHTIYKEDL